MLDEYYRNGKLFLAEMEKERREDFSSIGEVLRVIDVTDEFIRKNFRKPVEELVGSSNVGSTEKDMLKAMKKYFEVSGRSIRYGEILGASFFNTKRGQCSYCGKEEDVFPNRIYVFPFERKIDSITPEEARLSLCKKCGFTLFSAMAYLYKKGRLMFFFDSYDLEHLWKINTWFKASDLRDPSNFNKIRKFNIPTAHPYETILVTLFEFVRILYEKKLIKDLEDTIGNVQLVLAIGSKQIYHQKYVEGNSLDKFTEFFVRLIKEGVGNWQKMDEKKRPMKKTPENLVFSGFFDNLMANKGDFAESCRLREEFAKGLLDGKIDFVTLNEIIMERIKHKERIVVPYNYLYFVTSFMEVFGLEKEMFDRINKLGYVLGSKMKGTNLDNFVWEVFRARGLEQFYSSLVELQAKLKISMDLRAINESEKSWREAKAILLNGMLSAIHGGK
ncbi:MAG: hypothetical protein WED04_10705 [Promethearchaeati archaeon SRVP18_Atabeyarchaeia-1]